MPEIRLICNCFPIAIGRPPVFFPRMSRRWLTHWLPLVFWMCVIFSASTSLGAPNNTSRFIRPLLLWLDPHISEATINLIHHIIRKTAHAVEYAILGMLLWRVVHSVSSMTIARQFRLALLCAALYAASDETHQIFVPNREPQIRDVLLDTCGATAGLALAAGFTRWREGK